MRKRSVFRSVLSVVTMALLSSTAVADISGFFFDLSENDFLYQRGAGSAGSEGQITISAGSFGRATANHFLLGADNAFGGTGLAADRFIDRATSSNGTWSLSFVLDVFKVSSNHYFVSGTLAMVDATGNTVLFGAVNSATFDGQALQNGDLTFLSGYSNPSSILKPDGPNSWVYTGDGGNDDPLGLGLGDGNTNTITLSSNRNIYTTGSITETTAKVGAFVTLDQLFGTTTVSAPFRTDIKITVVPAPAAALLGVLGFGIVTRLKRRLSA